MKRVSVAVIMSLFAVTAAVRAEDKPKAAGPDAAGKCAAGGHAVNPQDRMQLMSEKLGLDDKQKEQLKPILQEQQEKMRGIFTDASLAREQKMEKIKVARTEFDAKIKGLLTPEQFEKWQKMHEEMRAKAGDRLGKLGSAEKAAAK